MRTGRAPELAAANAALAEPDVRRLGPLDGHPVGLEARPGEDEEAPQIVLVEISDRIDQISIEGHGSGDL